MSALSARITKLRSSLIVTAVQSENRWKAEREGRRAHSTLSGRSLGRLGVGGKSECSTASKTDENTFVVFFLRRRLLDISDDFSLLDDTVGRREKRLTRSGARWWKKAARKVLLEYHKARKLIKA